MRKDHKVQLDRQVRKALQAIIGQTRRMHGLLRDLIQFARPAAPALCWVDLPTLLAETATGLQELAAQRRVRIDLHLAVDRQAVHVDPDQLRVVAACLLRSSAVGLSLRASLNACCLA